MLPTENIYLTSDAVTPLPLTQFIFNKKLKVEFANCYLNVMANIILVRERANTQMREKAETDRAAN